MCEKIEKNFLYIRNNPQMRRLHSYISQLSAKPNHTHLYNRDLILNGRTIAKFYIENKSNYACINYTGCVGIVVNGETSKLCHFETKWYKQIRGLYLFRLNEHVKISSFNRNRTPRFLEFAICLGARYGDKIMKKLSHIDHICLKQSYKIGSIELSESKFITANKKETVLSDTDTKITDCGPVKLASHHFPKNHMICSARYLRNSLRDMRWEYLSNRIHK
jgi:hypothetical protein